MSAAADFAAVAITLYAAHHVGDYWVQTDHQARHKGLAGQAGRIACLNHVTTYVTTQWAFMVVLKVVLGVGVSTLGLAALLLVSGVTHYLADRREHGLMFWLARQINLDEFLALGRPREPRVIEMWSPCPDCEGRGAGGQAADESTNGMCWTCRAGGQLPHHVTIDDAPQLATGGWALDQAWHIFWGVFVAALLAVAL